MSETQAEVATSEAPQADAEFEGEFDADKAAKLIKALRADKRSLQAKIVETTPQLQRLASLEAAAQTDAERQAAALKEAETRAERAEKDAMRASVALSKGLPPEVAAALTGDDQASLEANADALLAWRADASTPRAPRPDMSQGSSSTGRAAEPRDQFAALLNRQLGR
jgi:hypothetical protein